MGDEHDVGSEHSHAPEAIRDRIDGAPDPSYLRDWVYGGIDGAVTTFAIVSGVVGAQLPLRAIVILGLANVVADGFSMAAGNFLATRTEHAEYRFFEAMERRHLRDNPAGEQAEVRQIYRNKGFEGELLEDVVEGITADRQRWVETMLVEEHGLPRSLRSPWRAAFATFAAFVICGLVPLAPYMAGLEQAFPVSCLTTGAVFFAIGSLKAHWSISSWWRVGLETLALGLVAAGLAYGLGSVLGGLGS